MKTKVIYISDDGKEFESESLCLEYEKSLTSPDDWNLNQYLKTYEGQRLKKLYDLSDTGTWSIYGEDPNCDFGGHHHNPRLETVTGKLEDIIKYACKLKRFYTWGAGGKIKKVEVKVI